MIDFMKIEIRMKAYSPSPSYCFHFYFMSLFAFSETKVSQHLNTSYLLFLHNFSL